METTALYRHYDADGTLLYVGIALSPIARLCEHRDGSAWYDRIATVKIARYPSREDALAAESEAIRTERPLHNVVGNDAPMIPANVRPRPSAHKASRLSAAGVAHATAPGYHCDGAGLYLAVTPAGTKSWIFRFQRNKRRREMGLGAYPVTSLAQARELAHQQRQLLREGLDPIECRAAS